MLMKCSLCTPHRTARQHFADVSFIGILHDFFVYFFLYFTSVELNVANFHIHFLLIKHVTKDLLSVMFLTTSNLPQLKCPLPRKVSMLSQAHGLFSKPAIKTTD